MSTDQKIIKNKVGLLNLEEYTQNRPHSGKYCFGKTPMQTFLDSRYLAHEKQLDRLANVTLLDTVPQHTVRFAATLS